MIYIIQTQLFFICIIGYNTGSTNDIEQKCMGPSCTIPWPGFCNDVTPTCAYSTDGTFIPVLAQHCQCPPALKSVYGNSLPCIYDERHPPNGATYTLKVRIGNQSGSALNPQNVADSNAEFQATGQEHTCEAQKLYTWCPWTAWTEWSLVCDTQAYLYRVRSRGCCPLTNFSSDAHLCSTHRDGNPLQGRIELESKNTTQCPKRIQFLDPHERQSLVWTDYLLLILSVVLLLLIIAAIVVILKVVKL